MLSNQQLSILDVKVNKSQMKPSLQIIPIDPNTPAEIAYKLKNFDTS